MKTPHLLIFSLLLSNWICAQAQFENKATCSQKEEKMKGFPEPSIINTCTWLNYECVESAFPNFNGRYNSSYTISKLINGKYVEITANDLFNEKKNILLERINVEAKKIFKELKAADPYNCLRDYETAPLYTFDELEIYFDEEGFVFCFGFGFDLYCEPFTEADIRYTFSYPSKTF
jgi:hypothetical protein